MQGIVKNKNDKGFGFIAVEGQKDLFFHANDLIGITFDELEVNAVVIFEIEQTDKGPKACKVQLAAA